MQTVEETLPELAAATVALIDGIGGLTDADARGPSLLPGWTRGHVLTHLARNAEGGTRLLGWARTGIPSYEYESVTARAEAIEQGAGRPAVVLLADVSAASAGFAEAADLMPPDAWHNVVTWTTGHQTEAEHIVQSRFAEVLIHHVDLDLGFGPGQWPAWFVDWLLPTAVDALNNRQIAPLAASLHAADTGRDFALSHDSVDPVRISGTEADLPAWVLGRPDGNVLARDKPGPLPSMPSSYYA